MLGTHSPNPNCGTHRPLFLLATGGSAIKAAEVLKESGVPEEKIIFINLVRPSLPSPIFVCKTAADVRDTTVDFLTGRTRELLCQGAKMQSGEWQFPPLTPKVRADRWT
jgi:hypothetical protein